MSDAEYLSTLADVLLMNAEAGYESVGDWCNGKALIFTYDGNELVGIFEIGELCPDNYKS